MKGILNKGILSVEANSVYSATSYTEVSSIFFFNKTESTNVTVKVYLIQDNMELQIAEFELVEKDLLNFENTLKLQKGASIKAQADLSNSVNFVVFGEEK